MSAEFFQTRMGKKFYEADVPRLANALEQIAKEMKRANDMKEEELTKPMVQCRKCGEMRENWNANICKECWESTEDES